MKWFRGRLVLKARRLWHRSTLGLIVIKKKRRQSESLFSEAFFDGRGTPVRALAHNHPEGWKSQWNVPPTTTNYPTYRIGMNNSAASTRDFQSCPLLLLVREVACSDSEDNPPPLLHELDRAANVPSCCGQGDAVERTARRVKKRESFFSGTGSGRALAKRVLRSATFPVFMQAEWTRPMNSVPSSAQKLPKWLQ